MRSFRSKKKGAALLWGLALIGLGFTGFMLIIFTNIYTVNIEPLAQANINTTSVLNNVNRMTLVWVAMPWAIIFFFVLYIVAQGQKRFGEI